MSVGLAAIPIFFATSGYLLYLPFARRDFASGEQISLRQYAFNRARRIFPLYWVGLIVVLLAFRGGGMLRPVVEVHDLQRGVLRHQRGTP